MQTVSGRRFTRPSPAAADYVPDARAVKKKSRQRRATEIQRWRWDLRDDRTGEHVTLVDRYVQDVP
ncbi:MAG: hypothetical protein E6J83_16620 [Deltaproteobacteria bacterium]|nr:MAG: hypothetical protein E6J83_16620 [Deltaproteobacteria bacterium]